MLYLVVIANDQKQTDMLGTHCDQKKVILPVLNIAAHEAQFQMVSLSCVYICSNQNYECGTEHVYCLVMRH